MNASGSRSGARILRVLLLGLLTGCGPRQVAYTAATVPMTPTEAVIIAEVFVREQGYADEAPNRSAIQRDFMENGDLDQILSDRAGLLIRDAHGYNELPDDWLVYFRLTRSEKDPYNNPGLEPCVVIRVDKLGRRVSTDHQDARCANVQIVLDGSATL